MVSRLIAALLLGVGLVGSALNARQDSAGQDPVYPALGDRAQAQLARLEAPTTATRLPRTEHLTRNLSRYFVRYLVPPSSEELGRLLGTAERTVARAAVNFHSTLMRAVAGTDRPVIEADFVASMFAQFFRPQTNDYGETHYFSDQPPAARLQVDTIDLKAMADTGFAWSVLAAIDPAAWAGETATTPLSVEAIDAFHDGINTYTLLLWQLSGLDAKREFAPYVQSRHLRGAGKALATRSAEGFHPAARPAPASSPFTEVTTDAGVHFRHTTSDWLAAHRRYGPMAPSFSGGGVTAGDLDGDGWDDLVTCGGRGCSAFRNRRDGTFEDVTAQSGIALDGEARMALLADFDNDGDRDLFVTYARDSNRLLANDGRGTFSDVTAVAGLEVEGEVSGPAAAVDIDGDGLLDLYVGNFGDYLSGETPWQGGAAANGMPNRLYRNLGGLRFSDISHAAGAEDTGWAQALSHVDVERDGDQDLYIANDFGHNQLLINDGSGHFEAAGERTGSDDKNHGMNVSFADLNRDRMADILVTNIWFWNRIERRATETNTLLISRPQADGPMFERLESDWLLARDTGWAWAAHFFDQDLDGDDDLFIANGFTDYLTFIQHRPHPENPEQTYPINNSREPNRLLRQEAAGEFTDLPSATDLDGVNSRGAALFDYDHDGDLDLAISTFHSEARLFRNDAAHAENHWLSVELIGDPARGVNRDALGAQLVVTAADGLYVWRTITGGEGYLSQQGLSAHFGLGPASSVDLEIFWPNGVIETVTGIAADRRVRVEQGSGVARTLD